MIFRCSQGTVKILLMRLSRIGIPDNKNSIILVRAQACGEVYREIVGGSELSEMP
jgi:hypothetical protein